MCQAESPIKTLDILDIEKIAGWLALNFAFTSSAQFLHNQVRFVGTLERVGQGIGTQGCQRRLRPKIVPDVGLCVPAGALPESRAL